MSRTNWNGWLEHEGDARLTGLHDVEQVPKRAISGIWKFPTIKLPELCRHFLVWLEQKCIYALRVATRVGRIAGFALAWLAIVFAPLVISPGIITGGWALLALFGSWWGLQHGYGKTVVRAERSKEGFHA